MRCQWWNVRTSLAVAGITVLAFIVGARPGTPVRAADEAVRPRPASTHFCVSTGDYCFDFETVDATGTGHCNAVTGINDAEQIVGAYYTCASTGSHGTPVYHSFAAAPSPTPTGYSSPAPYPSPFTSESDGSANTFLEGLATGHGGPNFTNVYMVGYAYAPAGCTTWCGVQNTNGSSTQTWSTIADPSAGSCGVTEVMAVNDSRMGVGYYLKPTSGGCVQQAFEYYRATVGGSIVYVDIKPTVNAGEPSIATGISPLGAVVGVSIGAGGSTSGWLYTDRKYYSIQAPSGATSISPEGVNLSYGVAGYYVNTSGENGFLMLNGKGHGTNNFLTVNYLSGTVIRSLNTHWYVSGWGNGNGGTSHGFVGECLNCGVNGTSESQISQRK